MLKPVLACASIAVVLALLLVVRNGRFAAADSPDSSGPQPSPTPTPNATPSAAFDRHWYRRARAVAQEHALGDVFVHQIMQESAFRDDVIYGQTLSSAGAEGIAQIMPDAHPDAQPLDPDKALEWAATWMTQLRDAYGGDIAKALAAYNAGTGTVDQAVAAGGDGWQQLLPQETQDYLSAILSATALPDLPSAAVDPQAELRSEVMKQDQVQWGRQVRAQRPIANTFGGF